MFHRDVALVKQKMCVFFFFGCVIKLTALQSFVLCEIYTPDLKLWKVLIAKWKVRWMVLVLDPSEHLPPIITVPADHCPSFSYMLFLCIKKKLPGVFFFLLHWSKFEKCKKWVSWIVKCEHFGGLPTCENATNQTNQTFGQTTMNF